MATRHFVIVAAKGRARAGISIVVVFIVEVQPLVDSMHVNNNNVAVVVVVIVVVVVARRGDFQPQGQTRHWARGRVNHPDDGQS